MVNCLAKAAANMSVAFLPGDHRAETSILVSRTIFIKLVLLYFASACLSVADVFIPD